MAFGLVSTLVGALLLLPGVGFFGILTEWYVALWVGFGGSALGQALASSAVALPGGAILTVAYAAFLPRAAMFLWRSYRYVRKRRESGATVPVGAEGTAG